jgi:predicted DNA-binding transcriptional regulator YafY
MGLEPERRSDSKQLVRQWAMVRLLSDATEPLSVKYLADQLGVSKATIERDLATLGHEFSIIEEAAGKQKKRYWIDRKLRRLEPITFGIAELLAIHAALASMATFAGTPIHEDLQKVVAKIRGHLSDSHNGALDAMARVFVPHARGGVDYGPQREIIDQLVDAIARRRRCRLKYHAAWKGTTREHAARPLRLVWHQSALYLFACLGDRDEITTLAVHRIRDLEVLPESFAAVKLDTDAHVSKAFGIFVSDREEDVEIVFASEIAWRVEERTYHPDETKTRLGDGRLRYRVRTSAQWEIIPWVQSFGPLAELVAPASWRESLRANASEMARRYGAAV